MARINSYTKITGAPADSDCFIIDSTQGTAGTRIVLWSVLKSVLTGIFAPESHKHPGSDITSAVANANAATNDSVGQNIASTYVKEITANGRTITVKRGNDTTFTFQTQDTTYPVADASKSGIMAARDWSLLHSLKPINKSVELTDSDDLNSYDSVDKCGWYYAAGNNTVANKPSGVDHFGMFVMRTASSIVTQILYDHDKKIWTRSRLWHSSSWSPWTALVRTTDTIANATNATKATQDSAGQTINTTYVKSITASGRTVTVKRGNDTTFTFQTQDTTYPVADASKSGIMAARDWSLLHSLKPINKSVELTDSDDLNSYDSVDKCGWYYAAGNNTVANKPSGVDHFGMFVMRTASSIVTQILYDHDKKIWTRSRLWHSSSWSPWTALVRTTDTIANATNATKATQDSAGQTINTTYVKSITASGRTVTVTKGNGTTSTFTTQDTTYSAATQSADGLMSSADKRKLDGLSGDYASAIGLATSSKDGLMPKTDKAKLDAIGSIPNTTIDGFFRI